MSDWTALAIILAISIPVGLAIGLYLNNNHRQLIDRFKHRSGSMSWTYYAAGAVFFAAMAAGSAARFPFALFFSAIASLQLFCAVRIFLRDRTSYSLLHFLLTINGAAMFVAFCLWFGMQMAIVSGVIAVGAILLELLFKHWKKR